MNIKDIILHLASKNGRVVSEDIVKMMEITRQAAHMHLVDLVKDKKLLKVGKTKGSYYIPYSETKEKDLSTEKKKFRFVYENNNLNAERIFKTLSLRVPFIRSLSTNTFKIFECAFIVLLDNAIKHSKTKKIIISIKSLYNTVVLEIKDYGTGVFSNVLSNLKLHDEFEAAMEFLPEKGAMEKEGKKSEGGISFASKAADKLQILSGSVRLVIDNEQKDYYIDKIYPRNGTTAIFEIKKTTRKKIDNLYN